MWESIGPATLYCVQRGGYAAGAAPSEQPHWNEPTAVQGMPLLTYGQRTQYNARKRMERP